MKITVLLGALLCALTVHAADARPKHPRHHSDATQRLGPFSQRLVGCSDPVMRPCRDQVVNGRRTYGVSEQAILSASGMDAHRTHRRVPEGLARVMAEGAGRVVAPARYIRGRLRCALNVGAALAARGIRGTGSALAKSYLRWGHPSGPVPGAVAVFSRRGGGHVAIVDHVRPDGTVIYLNPSSRRQAWQVGPYSRKPIAYRVAGGW